MKADRPNHNMTHLVAAAIDIAASQSRLAAVKYLFEQGCAPETIANILANCGGEQCSRPMELPRLTMQVGGLLPKPT